MVVPKEKTGDHLRPHPLSTMKIFKKCRIFQPVPRWSDTQAVCYCHRAMPMVWLIKIESLMTNNGTVKELIPFTRGSFKFTEPFTVEDIQ